MSTALPDYALAHEREERVYFLCQAYGVQSGDLPILADLGTYRKRLTIWNITYPFWNLAVLKMPNTIDRQISNLSAEGREREQEKGDEKRRDSQITAESLDEKNSEPSTPPDESEEREAARKDKILLELEAAKKEEQQLHSSKSLWQQLKRTKHDPEEIATQPSVFDDPGLAKYFAPTPKWENIHRFDPTFKWTWGEENAVVRKVDWQITVWAMVAFFALDIGRGNLSQANTDNFLPDLGMTTNDYNMGNTIYQIAFLCAELPSQMISKRIGPHIWIPTISVGWSIVSGSQFWLSGKQSFFATRALLGLLQGGFIPDLVLYLSYFFKTEELPLRLCLFWITRRLVDIVAPLIAFGVLRMRGVAGREGWRWLFLIEGVFMLSVAIWSFFQMAPAPTRTKRWFRKNGWFTEREEYILCNRAIRDDPSKGDMTNRDPITLPLLWKSLCDFDMWPIYVYGLTWEVSSDAVDRYFTLNLRNYGFNTFDTNLLTIPTHVGGVFTMAAITYASVKWRQRAFLALTTQIWVLPCLIALVALPDNASAWSKYAAVTALLAYPSPHPLHVGWASANSNSVRTRAVSAALYNSLVQLSRIISSNIYREDDKPLYRRGNRVLVGVACMNICLYLLGKVYYMRRNKAKTAKWEGLTDQEKIEYLETTSDSGNKLLNFRFVH